MIKFTDTSGKIFAVTKDQVLYCRDITPAPNHGVPAAPVTQIYIGSSSFTVAEAIDDVVTALA